MLIRIISLVILFTFASIATTINAEDTSFLYPKKKPSVFKESNKKILPVEKPANKKKSVKINKKCLFEKWLSAVDTPGEQKIIFEKNDFF